MPVRLRLPVLSGFRHDLEHPNYIRLWVVPSDLHIPELHPVDPFGRRYLVSRSRVLRQALFNQFYQRFSQAQCMLAGLGQGVVAPLYGNCGGRCVGHLVAGVCNAVGIRHIGLDVQYRRAIEQIDAGQQ